jgi:hypothetical protein
MKLSTLIRQRMSEYLEKHPSASPEQVYDAVMAEEATLAFSQADRAQVPGVMLDKLAAQRLESDASLKGDYNAAFDAVYAENPQLARLYDEQQNPGTFAGRPPPDKQAEDNDLGEEVRKEAPQARAKRHSEASHEVDRLASDHLAAHPELKGDYNKACEAVLDADPNLRRRYSE